MGARRNRLAPASVDGGTVGAQVREESGQGGGSPCESEKHRNVGEVCCSGFVTLMGVELFLNGEALH